MQPFKPSEWAVVLPRRRTGMFESPHLEPASIVAAETGSALEECLACGQLRERVAAVLVDDDTLGEVCSDCREEHRL